VGRDRIEKDPDQRVQGALKLLFAKFAEFHSPAGFTSIKIVRPMPAVPGIAYPLLIDAVGRCPLEDSGGPPGYMEMLEALRDPAHPRHAEVIEWPGSDFDANDVDRARLEKNVAVLAKLMTPRRRASAKAMPALKRRKPSHDELF
jgi:hypothetical protein